jgi:2-amino-4-hydroxy-6-hydroxymethyldihydropteridine diphosphokinase
MTRRSAVDAGVDLPAWAIASEKRRSHIARVVALVDRWSAAMKIPQAEAAAWGDAARWHDALRDADELTLRSITGDTERPADLLHGPAAAKRLADDGERRSDVLDAIRWHTTGSAGWSRTGRALYMADFLEPGRKFMTEQRAYLAAQVPGAFDVTFREVVRMRIEWSVREGRALFAETAELWNSVQRA